MQSVMNLENVLDVESRAHRMFTSAVLVSAVFMLLSWNSTLTSADHMFNNVRQEALLLDQNQMITKEQKDVIWKQQLEPQVEESSMVKTSSPVSGFLLFLACCFANFLICSKRVKAKLSQMVSAAGRNEYSHLKAVTIAVACAAVASVLTVATSLQFGTAGGLGILWFVFAYIGLAPFASKQA